MGLLFCLVLTKLFFNFKVARTYLYARWLCFWIAFFGRKDLTVFYDFGNLETLRQISTVTIDFKLADIKLDSSSGRSLLFYVPYFSARLDFPSPPLSAPGSPRMMLDRISWRVDTKWHRPKPAFLGKTISRVVQCNTAESIRDLTFF